MRKKLPTKDFSSLRELLPQPDLNEIQIHSYQWFLKEGLKEIFAEVSPILDHTGKGLELYFEDYRFDEPRHDETTARFKEATYESALRVNVRLANKKTGKSETQEIYFGDFPTMTNRGTFIINGVERVVVSQIIRSAGVYFTAQPWRGKKLFGAKVIPNRGAWLEFETDTDGSIGVKIDRHRKVPVTNLLRVFGMSDEAMREALAGMEFCAGIPGSVGGAIRMNAGAYGGEIKDIVESANLLDASGAVRAAARDELLFAYRALDLPAETIIIGAAIRLRRGEIEKITGRVREIIGMRKEKHPLEFRNAGSVFKNPRDCPAGRLIEEAGLKGIRIGDAPVSAKHATFIVNRGHATAADILRLVALIQQRVLEKTGRTLETEVKIIGE